MEPSPSPPPPAPPRSQSSGPRRLWEVLFGRARDVRDPHVFHRLSLIAFLAWVGLGADGLSSSSYGPEAAYRALGPHTYLALALALSLALTVFIISYAYSRIIEHFPAGGGGYVVATALLGEKAGLLSGCALIVDYVLTIATSIVSGVDAIFTFLPPHWGVHKVAVGAILIFVLLLMNLRGIKESVRVLVPIFMVFVITHIILISYGILSHVGRVPELAHTISGDFHHGLSTLGVTGMLLLFLRAYSLGGSSYTGIEAVSNGLLIMREPRIETGKRTMVYMATSLAITAGGILLCYVLAGVHPQEGKTLNGTLAEGLLDPWRLGGLPVGHALAIITLVSEAALLAVAAQTGFIDGPRVMANMAVDSWFPHSFAALSDQLTMANGITLMGGAALAVLWYSHGDIDALLVMYSINVFVTFTLSQLGMTRFWIKNRKAQPAWRKHILIHVIGAALCLTVLTVTVFEKFTEGGWLTVLVTSLLVSVCYAIRRHYRDVYRRVRSLDELLSVMPKEGSKPEVELPMQKQARTAVILVANYSGLGVHTLLTVLRQFPGLYKQLLFISVAVVDSGHFKGAEEIEALRRQTEEALEKYVALGKRLGLPSASMSSVATEVVEAADALCREAARQYPNVTFFSGKLVFRRERWYERLLHNEMAYSIQRRLQWDGQNMVILPIRVTS